MTCRSALFQGLSVFGADHVLARMRVVRREVAVLTFHRVSDDTDVLWPPMPVSVFARLMAWLAEHARVVDIEALDQPVAHDGKPVVCISFDDGYADFHDNALPILQRYGLPCHHNICPGLIDAGTLPWTHRVGLYLQQHPGDRLVLPDGTPFVIPRQLRESDFLAVLKHLYGVTHAQRSHWLDALAVRDAGGGVPRLMNWSEVLACQASGVRFGSHSHWHSHLPSVTDAGLLRQEIMGSREHLTQMLGRPPAYFAFPNGFHDAQSLAVVRESGYRFALLCGESAWPEDRQGMPDTLLVPRITMAARGWHEEKFRALGLHERIRAFQRKMMNG